MTMDSISPSEMPAIKDALTGETTFLATRLPGDPKVIEAQPEPKTRRKRRTGHVNAFETGQPIPGEESPAPEILKPAGPQVYHAIAAVSAALTKVGIAKNKKADSPGAHYNFRGIDDIYNVVGPLLAENKLLILPRAVERVCEERQSRGGGALFYVTLQVRFDFVSAEDGSTHEVITYGEAMDSGDKATNKAMSAAYKYAAMMTFCIPTIGEDSEDQTHQVMAKGAQIPAKAPAEPAYESRLAQAQGAAKNGVAALSALWALLTNGEKLAICKSLGADPKKGCPQPLKDIAKRADEQNNPLRPPADDWQPEPEGATA